MRYEPLGCRKLLQAGDFVCFVRCSDGFIPKVPIEFSPAYITIHVYIYISLYIYTYIYIHTCGYFFCPGSTPDEPGQISTNISLRFNSTPGIPESHRQKGRVSVKMRFQLASLSTQVTILQLYDPINNSHL